MTQNQIELDGVYINAKKYCSFTTLRKKIHLLKKNEICFAFLSSSSVLRALLLPPCYLSLFLLIFLLLLSKFRFLRVPYRIKKKVTITTKLHLPNFWFCICTLKKNGCEMLTKKSSISLTKKKIIQTTSAKMNPNAAFFFLWFFCSHFLEIWKTKREWVQWSNNNYQAKMSNKDH